MKTMERLRDLVEYLDRIGMKNTSREMSDLMDAVEAQRRESIPRAAYERKKAGRLAHIRECETALAKRNLRIRELEKELEGTLRRAAETELTCAEHRNRRTQLAIENDELRDELADMRGRTMPEGIEWLLDVWPKWSNGEYCKFGDWWVSDNYGEPKPKQFRKLSIYTPEQLDEWGQGDGESYGYEWDFLRPSDPKYRPDKVEPPAPKVYDADGVEIRVGDTVWTLKDARELEVTGLYPERDSFPVNVKEHKNGAYIFSGVEPSDLTHRAPVIAADGEPLEVGQTVWVAENGNRFHVVRLCDDGLVQGTLNGDLMKYLRPEQLTHTKPEPDSWSSVWADVSNGHETPEGMMRRCRALAERERGE